MLFDDEGREVFHVVNEIQKNEFGFREDAAVIGESFKRHADTPAQKAANEIEQLITETDSVTTAEAFRKAKKLPFGGKIDPFKHIDETTLPTFLPRRGTEHGLATPKIEFPPLSHVEAAKQLRQLLTAAGHEWTADTFAWLQQRYPDSVPADDLNTIVAQLTRKETITAPLKIVGGSL